MKNHPKLENIPVVIMYYDDEDNNFVKECMETEAVECLMKPIGFKAIKHLKNLEKYLKMQQAED